MGIAGEGGLGDNSDPYLGELASQLPAASTREGERGIKVSVVRGTCPSRSRPLVEKGHCRLSPSPLPPASPRGRMPGQGVSCPGGPRTPLCRSGNALHVFSEYCAHLGVPTLLSRQKGGEWAPRAPESRCSCKGLTVTSQHHVAGHPVVRPVPCTEPARAAGEQGPGERFAWDTHKAQRAKGVVRLGCWGSQS